MSTLRSLVSTLSIAICLAASWPCTAKESVSQDDLSAQKELLQAKLDANKELTQKDIEILYKRFDAVDKRIDDQVSRVSDIGNSVDRFTTIIGVIGTLITVLLSECNNTFCRIWFSGQSGTLTGLSVHPASPVLLTKIGPLETFHSRLGIIQNIKHRPASYLFKV